jgi:hypothetical protein
VGHPEHGIDASRDSALDRYILHRLLDAPYIYMCVQRARSAVERVSGPAQRVHARRVERPTSGDQFALWHVVQDDFSTRLRKEKKRRHKEKRVSSRHTGKSAEVPQGAEKVSRNCSRRPQQASSHQARMPTRSRGLDWLREGRFHGMLSHPSCTIEFSDPRNGAKMGGEQTPRHTRTACYIPPSQWQPRNL